MKMFLENGFERTNLRDLCAEAGITTGSFYRHFTSKEDIFSYFVQPGAVFQNES
jgi:AcrR family transcriptional regulator